MVRLPPYHRWSLLPYESEQPYFPPPQGMLMELGPCQIVEEGDPHNTTASTKHNPHSWNQNANLLFLDQP